MIVDTMAPRRPKGETRDETLCGRVTKATAEQMEQIAESMRPQPSISQLVALAIEEFVERQQQKGKRQGKSDRGG